jgi:pimeloyl-ACP methyl ester carboxylesterase
MPETGQGATQSRRWAALGLALTLLLGAPGAALAAVKVWQTLPPPAALPTADIEGWITHEGARIWFAAYGAGPPVILLHGGDASGDIWGGQVPALIAAGHRVILIDSRGHGRSTLDGRPLGYELMATDVVAVMDALSVRKAAVVGWSDGAILGLILAMKTPERVTQVFAFGANMDRRGLNPAGVFAPILGKVDRLLKDEYARESETPDGYAALARRVLVLQLTQPNYSPAQLAAIHGPQIEIVDGDHDELILRRHTEYLAHAIPGAQLLILPGVSHFAPLQAPDAFNRAVLGFLDRPTP